MRVVSLGSGSSGNAVLVQAGQTAVLVDAGFPARMLATRLRQAGIMPSALSGILLTHEHSDHACGARDLAHQYGLPLVSDPRTIAEVLKMPVRNASTAAAPAPERLELPVGQTTRLGTLEVRSFPISHDAVAPCGFVLSSAAWCVGVVTDLGVVSDGVIEALRGAHLLIIEANHDRLRLLDGPYPHYLKQRILSPTGHLSNEQTSEALARLLDDAPRWVWLAHLSRTNNTPHLARAHVLEFLRQRGLRHIAPQPLPREMGPIWDTAALWATAPLPAPADALPTAERASSRTDVGTSTADALAPVSADAASADAARVTVRHVGGAGASERR